MIKPQVIKILLTSLSCLTIYFLISNGSWSQTTNQPEPQAATNGNGVTPINNLITNIINSNLVNKPTAATDPDNKSVGATQLLGPLSGTDAANNSSVKKITSLMYDDDELTDIQNLIDSLKNDHPFVPSGKDAGTDDKKSEKDTNNIESYVYLGSILYFDQNNWTVWINNKRVSYDDNKKSNELYLTKVDSLDVEVLWTMSISKWKILSGKKNETLAPKINGKNQVEVTFAIKPNQTYSLKLGQALEGMRVPAPLPSADSQASSSAK